MEQENQTPPTFGKHIPHHLREELTKAYEQKQGKEAEEKDSHAENVEEPHIEPQSQAENQSQQPNPPNVESQTEPQDTQNEPSVPHSEEGNDVKAWKGRLKKAQEERQQLNARLIEEAEARERAEKRLRELEANQQQQQSQPANTSQDVKPHSSGLTPEELGELAVLSPRLHQRLSENQTQNSPPAQTQSQPEKPNTSAQPTSQNQPTMTERDRVWFAEVQREIPEIQGLLGDPNFVAFTQSKTDWTGETGFALIQKAGSAKDVRLIPAIRHLIDEYQQSKNPTPSTVTVPPQKTAQVKPKASTPKTMTKKDEAHAELLARKGKTDELRKFLAQFKQ